MKLLSTLLLTTALTTAFGAQAELQTNVQTHSFSGSVGNTSTSPNIDPFAFDYFDDTLGTLTGAFVSYNVSILGGFIGADNQTNQEVNGTMRIGGGVFLESDLPFWDTSFNAIFDTASTELTESFTLAADPTLSIGGNGPDVYTLNGNNHIDGKGYTGVNANMLSNFIGAGTFDVDFRSYAILEVNAPGARGFFDSPDLNVSMSMYYTYEAPVGTGGSGEPNDVASPFSVGALGMVMMALGAWRRRQK